MLNYGRFFLYYNQWWNNQAYSELQKKNTKYTIYILV